MSASKFHEDEVEGIALGWFENLGYAVLHGPEIEPEVPFPEREDFHDPLLPQRLRDAIAALNLDIPVEAQEEAFRKLTHINHPSLIGRNHRFHQMLIDGVDVEYQKDGRTIYTKARVADFDNPENNDWLAVNQFTMIEGNHNRRPDVVLFLNGLPIVVIELKNPADANATIWTAFNQLQTYKDQISSLFTYNELLIISDGLKARFGSLTSNKEWFLPWRTVEGNDLAPEAMPQLQVMVEGMFAKHRLLRLIRHFIVFEVADNVPVKKIAGYHQFHAVEKAVGTTVKASSQKGDRRCGVVWHTQGSGKSLTMAFFAGRIVLEEAMENPTIVVITDRNDLDDQLFGTFSRCHELLRQKPTQAKDREDLREQLKVASGGVVFTTIQKFLPSREEKSFPQLSDRRNIVVIADEAHRSQYDFIDGFARNMRDALPNASFIGFTGTPLELTDKNTQAVFGDYIDIYDIQRAVDDQATVKIFYESRLAKLDLDENEKPHIDEEFEEITEGEELTEKEKLKTKWAALEALAGSEKRLSLIARDLVTHFEQRLEAMEGKALVVCMSRRICVELYEQITKIRRQWGNKDDKQGEIKVVMTGSASDPLNFQPHIRSKSGREAMAKRFKNPKDPLKVVIVRDMWLTGFDVPCLHTMYVDKPMRGHGLMQAIARVNRVFRDKPGGLVVDYIGLADQLKKALSTYTGSGGKGRTAIDQEEAVAVMLEKYEICCQILHGFDWSAWKEGAPEKRLQLLPAAQEHILAQENGKERFVKAVTELSHAFALAVPHPKALAIREDVGFFQAVRAALVKATGTGGKTQEDMEHAIRQLISKAVSSDKVLDIFAAAGLEKPEISILSDEFLSEVKGLPQKNLAVELLRKLLNDELQVRMRKNLVQARSFKELLEKSIRAYQNRTLETVAVIEELIKLAKEMREAEKRGDKLGLTEDEVAFYDALETNDSAVQVLGDETLKTIAHDLVDTVRRNVTIDWTVKESVRAKLRIMVKRILRKYGYPPDKQEKATQTVLEQAEHLCHDWAE